MENKQVQVSVPLTLQECNVRVNDEWQIKGFRLFGGHSVSSVADLGLFDSSAEEIVSLLDNGKGTRHMAVVRFEYFIDTIDDVYVDLTTKILEKDCDVPEAPLLKALMGILAKEESVMETYLKYNVKRNS